MNRLSANNIIKNNAKSSNKISLYMHEGILGGNIITTEEVVETPVTQSCVQYALDFSCPENSQYIPII